VIAYLLAAGYATRLHPLTLDRPKPLLEVAGAPILSHILRRVEAIPDLREVVVVGNHRFADALSAWRDETPCRVALSLLDDGSTNEGDKLGAVGDIAFALSRTPPRNEDWMVVAGDNLLDFDLAALREAFGRERRPMLVLREVPVGPGPTRYNEVSVDARGRVLRFREKPPDQETGLAALALYFFTPGVAGRVHDYLAQGGNPDAPGHFIAWLVERCEVASRPMLGEWFDIGMPETLADARRRYRPR
jgi:glucose-1-phosphate thymidylyltransferase